MDRSLLAFAFLAQASRREGDLLSGLAPLFKPIAKTLTGKRFDGAEFAALVAERYGIKVNSWAVQDFAPRLEEAGVLHRIQLSADAYEYRYAPVQEEFPEITETDISRIIDQFKAFADPILRDHKLDVSTDQLEGLLLRQLSDLNFLSILLKPQKADTPEGRRSRLMLPKTADQIQWEKDTESKARIDVLCASFIFHVKRTDKDLYDLLVRIASGALVLEVVLDFQEPQFKGTLERLTIILDAPFLMSLLDLSSEESNLAAVAVCEEMRAHRVQLATFEHCVEELKDNLKSVRASHQSGSGFGATSRRLSNPAFSAYLNGVLTDPYIPLKKESIRILGASSSTQSFQYFTEEDEDSFRYALGTYYNVLARDRDAASIAGTMRLRRGVRTRMARFGTAVAVFVTHNSRVADCARHYALRKDLCEERDVPPAITDRYLAGLLWVMYGGKAGEIAPRLLLANCAAALEPRSDVINRMHKFLTEISPKQAELFKVLMTDERAGQHLMQVTLGDSTYITPDNVEETLSQIRETVGEEVEQRAQDEIARIQARHTAELHERDRDTELLKSQLAAAAEAHSAERQRVAALEADLSAAAEERRRDGARLQQAQKDAREERRRRVQGIATQVSVVARRLQIGAALIAAVVTAAITYLLTLPIDWLTLKLGLVLVIAAVAGISFWRIPDMTIKPMVQKFLERNLESRLHSVHMYGVEREFLIDPWSGSVEFRASELDADDSTGGQIPSPYAGISGLPNTGPLD
jgi:hypothetical protein